MPPMKPVYTFPSLASQPRNGIVHQPSTDADIVQLPLANETEDSVITQIKIGGEAQGHKGDNEKISSEESKAASSSA